MLSSKLSETTYGEIRQQHYEVAVLPFGATEPHNLHLPYGIDSINCDALGSQICEEARRQGAEVILLPTVPYGTQTNHARFPFAMNLYPTTLCTIISDLVESLARTGIRKVVLLNGHGGNDLKWVLRELYGRTPVHLFLCNWYQVCNDIYKEIFEQPDNHAGEMETSLALCHCPKWVARTAAGSLAADKGLPAETRFDAVNRGWVSITRPWHLLTTNAGVGNPHAATAEKGERLTKILVKRLSQFLVELAAATVDERFPY